MTLDIYNGLANLGEHVQNIRSNLELVIQDSDFMCKNYILNVLDNILYDVYNFIVI